MLKDNTPHNRSLTATSHPEIQTDVFEETLSFDQTTGEFIFGSQRQRTTGAFHIALPNPKMISIHAGGGIEIMSASQGFLGPLRFDTSGALDVINNPGTRIDIDVTQLPSTRGVLGFLLFVRLTEGPQTVLGIQTPPFFVTQEQPSGGQELLLHYDRGSGDFKLMEAGSPTPLPGSIKVEKGLIIPRISDGSIADNNLRHIHVSLLAEEGIVFADPHPVVFTMAGPTATRLSDTEVLIIHDFIPGTGFGLSFGIKIPTGLNETCTIYSPDPIIADKQIGGSG